MIMDRRLISAAAILPLLIVGSPAPSVAQEVCAARETLGECHSRLVMGRSPAQEATVAATVVSAEERNRLNKAATGLDLSAADAQSAVRDFLPKLAAALIAPGVSEDASALGVRANFRAEMLGATLQLESVVHEPSISSTLLDSLAEGRRAAVRERLERGFNDFDDVTITGSGNVENAVLGRNFDVHQPLLDRLVRNVAESQPVAAFNTNELDVEYNRVVRAITRDSILSTRLNASECAAVNQPSRLRMDCFKPGARAAVENVLRPAATMERARRRALQEQLDATGIGYLAELVNNQPQLNFTMSYRGRAGYVGPDEWTGKARWELGFVNMNRLRRFCRDTFQMDRIDAACLGAFTSQPRTRRRLAQGDRLWAAADLTRREPYGYAITGEDVTINIPDAWQVALSGGYGRYLGTDTDDDLRDRIDVEASYRIVRDDPLRQDRFVANASYTYRLTDQTAGVLGLSFANRAEFLGDVDHRLGAHLGLTFKLPGREQNTSGATPSGSQVTQR